MKLTKREAIRECKRLWKGIGKSGQNKQGYIRAKGLRDKYLLDCPLCEYAKKKSSIYYLVNCEKCPLPPRKKMDFRCYELGFDDELPPSQEWLNVIKGLKE